MAGEYTLRAGEQTPGFSGSVTYEEELVRRAKVRAPEAWAEIYERNYPRIYRYMQARIGERETAEDLAASVFLEALKSIDRYTSRGRPLLAWLYTIARNLANYHHRTNFRRQGRLAESRAGGLPWLIAGKTGSGDAERREAAPPPGGGDPAEMAESWDVRDAVSRLSQDQREVILLRYFAGLTTPQVAALIDKRERAVYSLQARAIQALRRQLR